MSPVVSLPGTEDARLAATGVLLSRPPSTQVAECHTVYRLRRGRVGTAPLAAYYLPASHRADTAVMPGPGRPDGVRMLPLLAEMSERMAPWVRVDIVPAILSTGDPAYEEGKAAWSAGGKAYAECGGLAITDDDFILMALRGPDVMLDTLCHEILHHVWRSVLSQAARDILEAAVAQGPTWPGGYLSRPEEQVARMFAAWCCVQVYGMPGYSYDPATLSAHGIFNDIFTGGGWPTPRSAGAWSACRRTSATPGDYLLRLPLRPWNVPPPLPGGGCGVRRRLLIRGILLTRGALFHCQGRVGRPFFHGFQTASQLGGRSGVERAGAAEQKLVQRFHRPHRPQCLRRPMRRPPAQRHPPSG